ncbi:mobilization protein [Paraflavitalea sp. CAU 1676]|uniref:plasmid mobilization protein n=1 Tax=Paraflavitalea sp. CAU 1676 TaxID=3032598 RepID=UPI0023DC9380|nr:mobilization protein [Paraflavitalea sp. CAU 1676]MDF2188308.1 mobilization protein [Paraflavitalea sp. CAU 1676]
MKNEVNKHTGNRKGGRPKSANKKGCLLGVKCTQEERQLIEEKSKLANLSISEYLRHMGLTGKIDRREKSLPPEVLQLMGTLNHSAANLNQIAKKRNGIEPLNAIDRAILQTLAGQFKQIVWDIKNYLQ